MEFTRLFDILPFQEHHYAQKVAFANYNGEKWTYFSTEEALSEIAKVSAGLLAIGLQKGEKIAIIGKSGSPYWSFLDMAAQQIGIIVVPILAGVSIYQFDYILEECEIRHLFFDRIKDADGYVFLQEKNFFIKILETQWTDIICEPNDVVKAEIQQRKITIFPNDLATIIYTSGTTGEPKGVMLSHHNIVSNVKSLLPLIPSIYGKRTLSFLPLSHVFERTIVYNYMAIGASIYFSGGIDFLEKCLQEVKPHYFSSVPRVLEKMYDRIIEMREKSKGLKKWLLQFALTIGENFDGTHKEDVRLQVQRLLADALVYRKWRKTLGGNIEGIAVGAAALQPKISRLFSAAKIPIREGYGCTETSPVVAFNHFMPGGAVYGSVGMPVPGVEVRLGKTEEYGQNQGEVLVKGPNVMLGYYKKPLETAEAFTEDGWYKTGDIGQFTHKWFLKITDRKKDLFKTSQGKFVSPQVVENYLKTSPFIDQCLVFGLNKPYIVALIVPNFNQLKEWCEQNSVHWTAPQYMVINPKVEQFFIKKIAELNGGLEGLEKIKNFQLLFTEWSAASDELTPTLKMRRRIIIENNQKSINEMYQKEKL